MSREEKIYLTLGTFLTVIGVVMALWGTLYGYSFTRMSSIEAKQSTQDISNTELKMWMSEVRTDVVWIKQTLSNIK